jgi:hypothetical protein
LSDIVTPQPWRMVSHSAVVYNLTVDIDGAVLVAVA